MLIYRLSFWRPRVPPCILLIQIGKYTNIFNKMNITALEKKILNDMAVELADEFDRNFERKAFFTEKWASPKINNARGSVMNRSGR